MFGKGHEFDPHHAQIFFNIFSVLNSSVLLHYEEEILRIPYCQQDIYPCARSGKTRPHQSVTNDSSFLPILSIIPIMTRICSSRWMWKCLKALSGSKVAACV